MPGKSVEWLPQNLLDRMQSDLIAQGEVTRKQLAERLMEDAAPLAAYSIIELATSPEVDEGVRLRAAQDVLDRANGRAKTSLQINTTPQNPVIQLLEGVVVERPTGPGSRSMEHDAAPPYHPQAQGATVIDQEPAPQPPNSTTWQQPDDHGPFSPPYEPENPDR